MPTSKSQGEKAKAAKVLVKRDISAYDPARPNDYTPILAKIEKMRNPDEVDIFALIEAEEERFKKKQKGAMAIQKSFAKKIAKGKKWFATGGFGSKKKAAKAKVVKPPPMVV